MKLLTSDYEARIAAWLRRSPNKQQGTLDIPELSTAIGTTTGQIRRENQDRAVAIRFVPPKGEQTQQPFALLALCDGIGGMSEGDRCAEVAIAVTTMALVEQPYTTPPSERLGLAVSAANREVFAKYRARGGTTLVAVLFCSDGRTFSVSAGDSRIYRRQPAKADLKQASVDDTIAGELSRLRGKEIPHEQLDNIAGHLAQFVGIGDGFQPRSNAISPISEDEMLLLTSDGAHSIGASVMAQIIAAAPDQHTVVSRLLYLSRWFGGRDNATVVCSTGLGKLAINNSALRTASLEVWDAFGKCEFVLDADYLRSSALREQPGHPNYRPQEPEYGTSGHPEFRSPKKKGKRNASAKPDRRVEVQVTKEAIRNTPLDPTDQGHIADSGSFGPSGSSSSFIAKSPESTKPLPSVRSEIALRTNAVEFQQSNEQGTLHGPEEKTVSGLGSQTTPDADRDEHASNQNDAVPKTAETPAEDCKQSGNCQESEAGSKE